MRKWIFNYESQTFSVLIESMIAMYSPDWSMVAA